MSNNVTMATIAKRIREKNTPSAKRFVVICVALILSVILLGASISMMLVTAWADDGVASAESVGTNLTVSIPTVESAAQTEASSELTTSLQMPVLEPAEKTVDYVGTDEIRCYKSAFQYPEQRELMHRICKEFDVDEAIVLGICYHESRFQPYAKNVNANGTMDWGMAQCNDTTFAELNKRIGINSMEELLDAETSIRACCALLQYYQELGLSGENLLLAYQQGYGGYKAVMAGEAEPWAAYEETKTSIDIFDAYLAANN